MLYQCCQYAQYVFIPQEGVLVIIKTKVLLCDDFVVNYIHILKGQRCINIHHLVNIKQTLIIVYYVVFRNYIYFKHLIILHMPILCPILLLMHSVLW